MKSYDGSNIMFMANSGCNLNCEHCYISYKGNRNPDELIELINRLKDKYRITINGAELLVNKDYLRVLKEVGQEYVMTNGKAIYDHPELVNDLKENGIKSLSISYHFGIQEDISQMTYEKLQKVFDILNAAGIEYRLMTTITTKNKDLIEAMCEKAIELGAKGIKFTNYMKQGNALNLDDSLILSQEEIYEVLEEINRMREKYSKDELIIQRCGSFGKSNGKDNFKCTCISDRIIITPDNNVYPCIFLAKPGYEIGHIKGDNIYLDDEYEINSSECTAREICNRGKVFQKTCNNS